LRPRVTRFTLLSFNMAWHQRRFVMIRLALDISRGGSDEALAR
jgi:hypothetical protein